VQTARRLYVYLLAGIGLGVLVSGISLLLTTVLEAVGIGGGAVLSGEQATRERLTLATAMTAVSLPVWLIHWFLAERSVHPDRAAADVERSSAMRGLYFALVLGGLLIAAFVTLDSLITDAVLALLGEDVAFATHAGDIGLFVTAAAAWGYHLAIRLRDWRRGPIHGAGAWLPRAYLYVATFVGLFVMLFGLAQLLGLVARLALGDGAEPFDSSASWWALPLASALSPVIAGGATWLGHWWYASRLWADPGYRGTIERPARLRFAGFVVVLVVSAASALGFGGEVGRLVLGALLGVTDADPGAGGLLPDLVAAGAAAVLFAGTWWLHAGWLRRAADDPEAAGVVPRVDRLIAYPTALVGLAFGAVGIARLLGLVLDLLLGGGRVLSSGETSERVFAQFVPYAVLGIGLAVALVDDPARRGGRPGRRSGLHRASWCAAPDPRRLAPGGRREPGRGAVSALRHAVRAGGAGRRHLTAQPAARHAGGDGGRRGHPRPPAARRRLSSGRGCRAGRGRGGGRRPRGFAAPGRSGGHRAGDPRRRGRRPARPASGGIRAAGRPTNVVGGLPQSMDAPGA
jgi:hypothetical protein